MSNPSFLAKDEQDDDFIKKNRMADFSALFELLVFAKGHYPALILGLILVLSSSICYIISARYMGTFVEEGLMAKNLDFSIKIALFVLILEALAIILMWIGKKYISLASSMTINKMREKLFVHLQILPLSFYDRQPQGRIVTRITHDVEGIEQFFTNTLARLLNASITAIIAMGAMLVTVPRLGLLLLLSVFPVILFLFFSKDAVNRANRRMSMLSSACNAKLSEFLNGLEVIRSYGKEDWAQAKYHEAVVDHQKSQLAANALFAWSRPLISFLCTLPMIGLIWVGGKEVMLGTLSIGLFVAYLRYCERFYMPIMTLSNEIHVVQQALTSSERVVRFLKHSTESDLLGIDGSLDLKTHPIKGSITFKNVYMSYQKSVTILKDLNFTIQSGEKIGLVGSTGSGKTSMVSLLSRLYEYERGEILIDGVDLRSFKRDYLREQIGFVSQDVIIFQGTLKENLTTDEQLSDQILLHFCQSTGLYKVMQENQLSFESTILEGGANLSIGERQLIALTRILIRNPSILVLDEATANIDPHYEKIIQDAVQNLMKDRTCLMIAHRLDTIKNCDRILVFHQGRLEEEGSFDLLMGKKGHFYRLQESAKQALH
jgi:ATP-binding cassette, subfamily B, multidrug efflux pump